MNSKLIVLLFVSVMMVAFSIGALAQSQPDADVARMQAMQREVDEDAVKRGQKAHIELLAKQFQLAPSEIETLRNAGQGWGEVTIRLALADKLVKTDPTNFPTLNAALERIGTLRNDGSGWGKISKELGFKLGPVVGDIRHSLNELRRDLRAEQTVGGKVDKTGNAGDLKRETRVEPIERGQRPERPERPQRPERPERPEKPERNNR
jgi:hypothetical protein